MRYSGETGAVGTDLDTHQDCTLYMMPGAPRVVVGWWGVLAGTFERGTGGVTRGVTRTTQGARRPGGRAINKNCAGFTAPCTRTCCFKTPGFHKKNHVGACDIVDMRRILLLASLCAAQKPIGPFGELPSGAAARSVTSDARD